jgi:hypothetical protein
MGSEGGDPVIGEGRPTHQHGFVPVAEIVPPGEKGVARIEHMEVDKNDFAWRMAALRGDDPPQPGRYARLFIGRDLMMSDTQMEQRSNRDLIRRATGKVMIAGLGIGMVLPPLLAKEDVESVLVIEKYQEVIDLVHPHHQHPKLTVMQADILEFRPPKEWRFDTIYFDIWPDITTDNLKDIALLHRRWATRRNRENPRAWMGSWMHERLKYQRGRERRMGW